MFIKSDSGHNLKELDAEWRKILKWIFKKWLRGMHRIDLPQYRNRYRALLNAVMNVWVP
jgi:pyruvate-formate lyase